MILPELLWNPLHSIVSIQPKMLQNIFRLRLHMIHSPLKVLFIPISLNLVQKFLKNVLLIIWWCHEFLISFPEQLLIKKNSLFFCIVSYSRLYLFIFYKKKDNNECVVVISIIGLLSLSLFLFFSSTFLYQDHAYCSK